MMTAPPEIFDRQLVRRRRAAAAARMDDAGFLHRETAARLLERVGDFDEAFDTALAQGWDAAAAAPPARRVLYCDFAAERARRTPGPAFAADEEALPVRPGSLSLLISNLCLHHVNDLPGALLQIRGALAPGGLFLATLFGNDTLADLRRALMAAELECCGGASPRISPMADIRDLGALMQRAGFVDPVVDAETLAISHAGPLALMHDLAAMGESNALRERRAGLTAPRLLRRAAELYAQSAGDREGRVVTGFDILFLTGRAPSARSRARSCT